MRRKLVLLLLQLFMVATGVSAQTVDEWLRQRKTQQRYLLEQIAALRLYAAYAHEGYSITREGLQAIDSGKTGAYGLHLDFFGSRRKTGPTGMHWKVADAQALGEGLLQVCLQARQLVRDGKLYSGKETAYVERVTERLLAGRTRLLEALREATEEEHWEMLPEERLQRVETVYRQMREHYLAARHFQQELTLLAAGRRRAWDAWQKDRMFHGLTPALP